MERPSNTQTSWSESLGLQQCFRCLHQNWILNIINSLSSHYTFIVNSHTPHIAMSDNFPANNWQQMKYLILISDILLDLQLNSKQNASSVQCWKTCKSFKSKQKRDCWSFQLCKSLCCLFCRDSPQQVSMITVLDNASCCHLY